MSISKIAMSLYMSMMSKKAHLKTRERLQFGVIEPVHPCERRGWGVGGGYENSNDDTEHQGVNR